MSRNFRVQHKNQKHKHVVRSYDTTTSTPKTKVVVKTLNISLSEIESATSSSSGSRKRLMLSGIQQKTLKKRKRVNERQRVHSSNQSMKSITMEGSEWETVEEKINESSTINSQESTPKKCDNDKYIKLFEDISCTPEMIREELTAFEFLHESPTIGSSRLYLEKDIQHDDFLPINLSPLEERERPEEVDEDEEDEEIVLLRENNVKKYLTAREVKKKNNLFWCQIVESYAGGPISEFLASTPPPPRRPFTERNADAELLASQKTKVSRLYESKDESDEDDPISSGMMRVRGTLDKNTRQWKRTYEYGPEINKYKRINKRKHTQKEQSEDDIYSKLDKIDIEFETAGLHGKRMTFAQFRQRGKKHT